MRTTTESYIRQCLTELERAPEPDLVATFLDSSRRFADLEAFKCLGHGVTFSRIETLTRDFAAYLLGPGGLQSGDRIAIQLPNLVQYPVVAWGALRAGLTIVNTNPLYTRRELIHQFTDSGAKTLVCLSDRLAALQDVLPETAVQRVIATHVMDMIEPQPLPADAGANVISVPDALQAGGELKLPAVHTKLQDVALL